MVGLNPERQSFIATSKLPTAFISSCSEVNFKILFLQSIPDLRLVTTSSGLKMIRWPSIKKNARAVDVISSLECVIKLELFYIPWDIEASCLLFKCNLLAYLGATNLSSLAVTQYSWLMPPILSFPVWAWKKAWQPQVRRHPHCFVVFASKT